MVNNGYLKKKKTPGKRPQTVWGSGRIMYDNVEEDDDDGDDDDDSEIKRTACFSIFSILFSFVDFLNLLEGLLNIMFL